MTEEELLRQEYISLQKKIYEIRDKIRNSIENYDDLFLLTKEGIMIDKNVVGYNEFLEIKKNLDYINNNLTNIVIPRVNNNL